MKYLLITYLRQPDGQINEQVVVSKKVKSADQQTCNVIMNFSTKMVEKCVIEGKTLDTSWEKLNEYYRKVYPSLISQLEMDNAPKPDVPTKQ